MPNRHNPLAVGLEHVAHGYDCPCCTAFVFTDRREPQRVCPNCDASIQTQDIAAATRAGRLTRITVR